jgi:hypothetical protein
MSSAIRVGAPPSELSRCGGRRWTMLVTCGRAVEYHDRPQLDWQGRPRLSAGQLRHRRSRLTSCLGSTGGRQPSGLPRWTPSPSVSAVVASVADRIGRRARAGPADRADRRHEPDPGPADRPGRPARRRCLPGRHARRGERGTVRHRAAGSAGPPSTRRFGTRPTRPGGSGRRSSGEPGSGYAPSWAASPAAASPPVTPHRSGTLRRPPCTRYWRPRTRRCSGELGRPRQSTYRPGRLRLADPPLHRPAGHLHLRHRPGAGTGRLDRVRHARRGRCCAPGGAGAGRQGQPADTGRWPRERRVLVAVATEDELSG